MLLLAGCLPSVNPLYTEQDLVFDPALIGVWREKPSSRDSWIFTKRNEKSYQLVLTDDDKSSPFVAHLLKLGEQRFLNMQPDKEPIEGLETESTYQSLLVRGHLFLRVDQIEPKLRLAAIDADWLDDFLKKNPDALAHSRPDDRQLVLTASTAELQKFVLKHLKTEGAWGDPTDYERQSEARSEKPADASQR